MCKLINFVCLTIYFPQYTSDISLWETDKILQIGNNWVLTAAHCVYSVDDEQVSLNKGAMDVTESLKILKILALQNWLNPAPRYIHSCLREVFREYHFIFCILLERRRVQPRAATCKLPLRHPRPSWSEERERTRQVEKSFWSAKFLVFCFFCAGNTSESAKWLFMRTFQLWIQLWMTLPCWNLVSSFQPNLLNSKRLPNSTSLFLIMNVWSTSSQRSEWTSPSTHLLVFLKMEKVSLLAAQHLSMVGGD